MPLIKSAVKKMKQDRRRYAQNLRTKRAMRTATKAFEAEPTFDNMRTATKAFENEPTFDSMRAAQSAIDTAAKKKVISKQAAARRIAHIAHQAKEAGVKIPSKKK